MPGSLHARRLSLAAIDRGLVAARLAAGAALSWTAALRPALLTALLATLLTALLATLLTALLATLLTTTRALSALATTLRTATLARRAL